MSNEHAKKFAEALRTTADLVERGLIAQWDCSIEYDIATTENLQTGMMEARHTGWQTVTVVLQGNPRDLSTAGWKAEHAGLADSQRQLPTGNVKSSEGQGT